MSFFRAVGTFSRRGRDVALKKCQRKVETFANILFKEWEPPKQNCKCKPERTVEELAGLESGTNIAGIVNAVPVTLYSRVSMNVEVLNCQKYFNQCFKGHRSLSCSLSVFSKCNCNCQCLLWSGQVSGLINHSEQILQVS